MFSQVERLLELDQEDASSVGSRSQTHDEPNAQLVTSTSSVATVNAGTPQPSSPTSSIADDALGAAAAASADFCGESVASSHVTDVSIEIEDVVDVTGDDRSTASSRDAHSAHGSDEGGSSKRESQRATLKTTEEWLKSSVKPLALKKNAADVTQPSHIPTVKVVSNSAVVDAFDPLAQSQSQTSKSKLRRSASDLNQSEAKKQSTFSAQTPPEVRWAEWCLLLFEVQLDCAVVYPFRGGNGVAFAPEPVIANVRRAGRPTEGAQN